jgi:hypothetical protein
LRVSAPENDPPTDHVDVNALQLLRLVRIRRELKLLCVVAILALPLWGGFTLIAETVLPRSSRTFWSLDSKIGPGFLIILGVLVASFLLLAVSRFAGHAGPVAAQVMPIFGRGPEPRLTGEPAELMPLLGLLRRKPLIPMSGLLILAVCGLMAGVTGWNFWPAWQGNHGHGGQVVTIGDEATISGYEIGSHGHRDYYLDTPDGKAIAEDYRPHNGQRWTVRSSGVGNDKAYLVGGHDYILVGLLALVGTGAGIGVVIWIVGAARRELATRRCTEGRLADSVTYLGTGHRAPLDIGRHQPVTLILPPLEGRSPDELLASRRAMAVGTAAVLIVGTGVPLGLWQAGTFRPPPKARTVNLSFLADTGWRPSVYVSYINNGAASDLLRDALRDGGVAKPKATVSETVLIDAEDEPRDATAYVDIADIGSTGAPTAVAGVVALQKELTTSDHGTVSTMTGLPGGWRGVVEGGRKYDDPGVELAGADDGRLVWLSLHGKFGVAAAERSGTELARAIARQGIKKFAGQVAR